MDPLTDKPSLLFLAAACGPSDQSAQSVRHGRRGSLLLDTYFRSYSGKKAQQPDDPHQMIDMFMGDENIFDVLPIYVRPRQLSQNRIASAAVYQKSDAVLRLERNRCYSIL